MELMLELCAEQIDLNKFGDAVEWTNRLDYSYDRFYSPICEHNIGTYGLIAKTIHCRSGWHTKHDLSEGYIDWYIQGGVPVWGDGFRCKIILLVNIPTIVFVNI